ncbi:hypothetical protein [uncultured Pseudomonas sp.]|uniref:hypothetical protein n=1 Tax=uncultured Pseudomonas sp. TaxID=114707 RepID=UPI0030DAFF5C
MDNDKFKDQIEKANRTVGASWSSRVTGHSMNNVHLTPDHYTGISVTTKNLPDAEPQVFFRPITGQREKAFGAAELTSRFATP